MDSNLQIISGQFRGRKLLLPPNALPTQNRAREALFNMLDSGIVDPVAEFMVWDAFAGSGAFGIECLSRYPLSKVLFTDVAWSSISTVRANLGALAIGRRAEALHRDAIPAIQQFVDMVDLVFVDPPYAQANLGYAFVKRFGRAVRKGVILIWEQDLDKASEPDTKKWKILRDKTYGRARFLILQRI